MIAKGLDFPNVTVVGVINADIALHFQDFRAGERTFTLITQVAGRTGRGPRGGRVLVQTFSPEHPAIVAASRHDYATFARLEMAGRREYRQPPFGCWTRLIVRGPDEVQARSMAQVLAELAREWPDASDDCSVMGPAEAPLAKLRGEFRFHLVLQTLDEDMMHDWIGHVEQHAPECDGVRYAIDFDPLDML
jgi:primosomal protein N' (replication factor Y)